MDEHEEWRPRLSVTVSPEVYRGLQRHVPHGYRTALLNLLLGNLIEKMEAEGPTEVLALVLAQKVTADQLLHEERLKDHESYGRCTVHGTHVGRGTSGEDTRTEEVPSNAEETSEETYQREEEDDIG